MMIINQCAKCLWFRCVKLSHLSLAVLAYRHIIHIYYAMLGKTHRDPLNYKNHVMKNHRSMQSWICFGCVIKWLLSSIMSKKMYGLFIICSFKDAQRWRFTCQQFCFAWCGNIWKQSNKYFSEVRIMIANLRCRRRHILSCAKNMPLWNKTKTKCKFTQPLPHAFDDFPPLLFSFLSASLLQMIQLCILGNQIKLFMIIFR